MLRNRTFVVTRLAFIQPTVGLHQVWGKTEIQWLINVLGGFMCMFSQGYSLSMLHRTCEYMQRCIRLVALSMPNIMHMPFYFKLGVLRSTLSHIFGVNGTYLYLYLQHIWIKVLLNTPWLKIKRNAHDIGHDQSTQPNTPMQFFTGSMKHVQRTSLSKHGYRIY